MALVGPSGCGKSTVLNMIAGLVAPTGGAIRVDGRALDGIPPQVGYVFQKDTVFPWRTVFQNVELGLTYRGVARAERARRAREAIRLAGLEGFEDAFPATLSGGMRQRVALIRTLVVEPEILLMDEPFGALDTHTKLRLQAQLLALWTGKRQTIVFVTHDLAEAITLADRVIVLTSRPGASSTSTRSSFPVRAMSSASGRRRTTRASSAPSGTCSGRSSPKAEPVEEPGGTT